MCTMTVRHVISSVSRFKPQILYREIWEKVNVTWLEDGNKVEFGQKKIYHFQEHLSYGSEDTKLILPNLPMMVCSHY